MTANGEDEDEDEIGGDGEAPRRPRIGRKRKDPRHYQSSGLYIETWRGGRWRLVRYYRDRDAMRRAYRAMTAPGPHRWTAFGARTTRMRWPGDGRTSLPPETSGRRASPDQRQAEKPSEPPPAAYLQRIRQAMEGGLRLSIGYEDSEGRRTHRTVKPLTWSREGELFVAHCELRGEERHFRVHRLLDCQIHPGSPDQPD